MPDGELFHCPASQAKPEWPLGDGGGYGRVLLAPIAGPGGAAVLKENSLPVLVALTGAELWSQTNDVSGTEVCFCKNTGNKENAV